MKIQSRPPVILKPEMTIPEMTSFIRNIMEIDGYGNGDKYREVLTIGALSMLKQLDVISDYQARFDYCGMYNVWAQVRTPDGECHTLTI